MVGQTISRYRALEYLGGNGMGIVYKAQALGFHRFVAPSFSCLNSSAIPRPSNASYRKPKRPPRVPIDRSQRYLLDTGLAKSGVS